MKQLGGGKGWVAMLSALALLWFGTPGTEGGRVLAAAERFPGRPIVLIVPFAPGGGFDVVGRRLAATMQKHLGVPVVVQNIPGGGQRLGAAQFERSAPDGYTIGYFADAGLYVAQLIEGQQAFDVTRWGWVGSVREAVAGVVVASNSPFRTLQDVLTARRRLRIPDIGVGSGYFPLHVVLVGSLGLDATIIGGYGGTSEMIPALLRGEADLSLILPITSGLRWIQAGDLRVLAVVSGRRLDYLPDVPTLGELNAPSLDLLRVRDVYGIVVPPGTPADRTAVLENALRRVLSDPEFLAWAEQANVKQDLVFLSGEDLQRLKAGAYETYERYQADFKRFAAR